MTNHPKRFPIQPPPAGSSASDDRDDACADAMAPAVAKIVSQATAAGWSEPEILVAILATVVSEMRGRADDRATRETLGAAIMMLDD